MGKKLNKLKQEEDVMTDLTFESSQNDAGAIPYVCVYGGRK